MSFSFGKGNISPNRNLAFRYVQIPSSDKLTLDAFLPLVKTEVTYKNNLLYFLKHKLFVSAL